MARSGSGSRTSRGVSSCSAAVSTPTFMNFGSNGLVDISASLLRAGGPCTLTKNHLAGGASRLAALLLPQILRVFSVVAPCHPGVALGDLVLAQRGRPTSLR